MPQPFTIIFGKTIRHIARLRGGGSALPGLFVERIDPSFVPHTLAQLPQGVVVISGTNGKTTTTKMVVSLLESQGLKVFTNRTGSNFVRGVAAALLGDINVKGKLSADIAVLELDEAHAVKFVEVVKPRFSLLLNVMRDQLDRFGEIDTTAHLLQQVADATTDTVVTNANDPRLSILEPKTARKVYFGLSETLIKQFPTDDALHGLRTNTSPIHLPTDVMLKHFTNTTATFTIQKNDYTASLKIKGMYNILNSAAAIALVRAILPKAPINDIITSLATITPAFGRGETVTVHGQPLELVLVKNPSGFRLGLKSFQPSGYATMIAINDNYADGRDVSWLWDVDFTSLAQHPIYVSGIRAYDMALRLQYDNVNFETIDTHLNTALSRFIKQHASQPKRIYCTYTAMLTLRKELAKHTTMESVL